MKRIPAVLTLASLSFLLLPQVSFAQEAQQEPPRFAVSLHGNTGSPPMLGISYFFSDRVALRSSIGFYPETGSYTLTTTSPLSSSIENAEYDTQWYGAALAGLYYLPELWRVQLYTGLKAQYVRASSEITTGINQASNRIDAGALAGTELRVLSWLRLSGEVGVGYKSGLSANTGIVSNDSLIGLKENTEYGLTHAGLGIQVQIR